MSICPHPCPSGPTVPSGRGLGAGLGLSPSIPVGRIHSSLDSREGARYLCTRTALGRTNVKWEMSARSRSIVASWLHQFRSRSSVGAINATD